METWIWAKIFWAGGLLATSCLAYVLLVKGRWRKLPVFSIFIAFQIFRTAALFAVRKMSSPNAYFAVFWSLVILDNLFQIAVIVEFGMKIAGTLVEETKQIRSKAVLWSALGVLSATVVCAEVSAPSLKGIDIWDTRFSLFTSLITCQTYWALSTLMNQFGVRRGAHVLAIGSGLTLWSVVALSLDGLQAMTGWRYRSPMVDYIEMTVYIGVTIYWTCALWPEEPTQTKGDTATAASIGSIVVVEHNSRARLKYHERAD